MSHAETDKQKLERLAKLHQDKWLAAKRQQEAEAEAERKREARRDSEDQEATRDIFAWCKETLDGFKVAGEYAICIFSGPNPSSHYHNERPDGVPYVSINIRPQQGTISIMMARHRNQMYQLYRLFGSDTPFPSFESFKDAIINELASMSKDDVKRMIGTTAGT